MQTGLCATVVAADNPVILQWYESRWTDIEHRVVDLYLSGYSSVLVPPGHKASSSGSAGYDVWDRFDLGSPTSPTAYGTEQNFRAMVEELHQSDTQVYFDAVLNHNASRQTSTAFQQAGGYPGFWMAPNVSFSPKQPTDNWGDFHAGVAGGYLQSTNPGSANYDLYRGDLVSLIDIAHETNNLYIRQPVAPNAQNIPAGTSVNRPDSNNSRCYPDRQLTPFHVVNPGTSRNPGSNTFDFYPYNTADPSQGDPVADNGTGMLMRWTQFMLDNYRIDGFRLDAIKHVPSWFWDTFYDSVLYQRRVLPDGRRANPFSFGECVESNSFTYQNFIRKDSFGNRDCLDLNGAGQLRDLVGAAGLGSWQNVLSAHLDNADDNDNNGSIGVNHVYSHDNGTTGDGSAAPPQPTVQQMGYFAHAYTLMRTGYPLVYHNARGISRAAGGFWPKNGATTALGLNTQTNAADPTIPNLVKLHGFYARGAWNVINSTDTSNTSLADVIVFERRKSLGGGQYSGNVLVGVNDRYDSGYDQRNVLTSFPAGTRLLEMTGNAANAAVDPLGDIADVLVVDANKRVTIRIPRNASSAGAHHKGFVVYGPAIPAGTLTLTNAASTLPADDSSTTSPKRRLNPIPVITGDSFQIDLVTTNGDPGAGNNNNADDNAVFKIDQGYRDFNGNGLVDIDGTNGVVPGYEQFVTVHQPLINTANVQGHYAQTIDATRLSEGFHYLSVVAFRGRNAGEDPLFREFRQVVYIDRACPAIQITGPSTTTSSSVSLTVKALDRTLNNGTFDPINFISRTVHLVVNPPANADPATIANGSNQCNRVDRFQWSGTAGGLLHGNNRVAVCTFEESGRGCSQVYPVFVNLCIADVDDGSGTGAADGGVGIEDLLYYLTAYNAGVAAADVDDGSGTNTRDGGVGIEDLLYYLGRYNAGC